MDNKVFVVMACSTLQGTTSDCSWHRTEAGALAKAKELQKIHDEEYERFLVYTIMALPLED